MHLIRKCIQCSLRTRASSIFCFSCVKSRGKSGENKQVGKGTKSPGEQNTARFFSPDCFYGPCVCLCICLTQTPWKCPAFLDTGKEANTLLRRKTKFLKDNNFFFCSKEVCRNLHGNILCYVVYNLYSLAQMKENSLVFGMISLR